MVRADGAVAGQGGSMPGGGEELRVRAWREGNGGILPGRLLHSEAAQQEVDGKTGGDDVEDRADFAPAAAEMTQDDVCDESSAEAVGVVAC